MDRRHVAIMHQIPSSDIEDLIEAQNEYYLLKRQWIVHLSRLVIFCICDDSTNSSCPRKCIEDDTNATSLTTATMSETVPAYASDGRIVEPPPYSAQGAPSRTRPQQAGGYASSEHKVIERPISTLTDIKIVPESHLKPLITSFAASRAIGYSFHQDRATFTQVLKAFDIAALHSTSQAASKEYQIRANITMTTRETLVMLHRAGEKESFASLVPSCIRKVANPSSTVGQIIPPPDPTAKYSFAFVDPRYLFSLPDVPMRLEFDATFQSDGLKRSTIWVWAMGDRWFRWAKWLPIDQAEGTGPIQDALRQGGTRLDVAMVDGIGELVRSLPFEKACTGKDSDVWMPLAIWRRNANSSLRNNIGHVEWILAGDTTNPLLPQDLAAAHLLSAMSNSDQGPARWERFVLAMLATLAHVKVPYDPRRDPNVAAAFGMGMAMR